MNDETHVLLSEKLEDQLKAVECVFCKHKFPKNAEAFPKSCSGKFLKVAGAI